MASEKQQSGTARRNVQHSPVQHPPKLSSRTIATVMMVGVAAAMLTILASFLRQQCAPQKAAFLPMATLPRTPRLTTPPVPAPTPSPTVASKMAINPGHRCVGTWAYVPKNLEAEVGFSIHVPTEGKVKLQFSDYGSIVGDPRSIGDPTLVRTSDAKNPTDFIFFNCSLNGQLTSAILNGRSYLLRPTKGDIFEAERVRGRTFDD